MLSNCLRAETFGVVVTAIKNIQTEFLHKVVGTVFRLSGDKKIDALIMQFADEIRVGSRAGHNAHRFNLLRPEMEKLMAGADDCFGFFRSRGEGLRGEELPLHPDQLAVIPGKRLDGAEAEPARELSIIAHIRMGIKGQMRRIQRDISFNQGADALVYSFR